MIDIQHAFSNESLDIPSDTYIQQVINVVLSKFRNSAELSIRIVDNDEITALNSRYRHKNSPTNILSFPVDLPAGITLEHELLGDMVIAAEVVKKEALAQNKSFIAHFTHMLIHGALHLLGFDHKTDKEAEIMENHEIKIMQELKLPAPYIL
ncbi:MAG: rRNA maturation RNase YbeY [Gammaproteobacteria bacterium]|nr:rRNA maturation RNase YbeY [Gammaproteobacteria bacterium]